MNENNDSVDDFAILRVRKHWSNDSRTRSISYGAVRAAVTSILAGLAVDPVTLKPLAKEPLVANYRIEQELLEANRLSVEAFAQCVARSLTRILQRTGSLTHDTDAAGFVILTYTP